MGNIADDASGTNEYARYQYIGGSMIVSISHPDVSGGLNLSYGASGTYDGWDRFGRIVDQNWTDDSAATIDQIQHSYDRGSNRLTRTNGLNSALDEVYTYDGLDRLIDTNRNGANLQDWSLDALGNWRGFTDGATTQTRTNNTANEITGISGAGWIAPVYDAAGNMTSGPKPGDETTRLHFKYDAWNRLAEVKDDNAGVPGTTIASYEYDGRNYRVEKTIGADTSDLYYNEAWQVLEVRQNGDTDPLEQNVWDVRYVDAPIVRFLDANTDGDYADATDSTLYYIQDANFNVTALVDATTGDVVERYSYDPYGKATVYDANWTVRPAGSAYNNELRYAGYRLDPETGLYQVRNRFYHTALGTWISRDPVGILGGPNQYEYVRSSPPTGIDPQGTIPLDTVWDLGNIVYDIAVGDYVSLSADVAALAIPYFPAGTTKLVKAAKLSQVSKIDDTVDGLRSLKVTYEYVGQNSATRYAKHFLHGKKIGNWVEATKHGASKWAPGTTDATVRSYIDSAFKAAKKSGSVKPSDLDGRVFNFPDSKRIIGASNGKCTTKIKLHVNSQGQVHAFPIN